MNSSAPLYIFKTHKAPCLILIKDHSIKKKYLCIKISQFYVKKLQGQHSTL